LLWHIDFFGGIGKGEGKKEFTSSLRNETASNIEGPSNSHLKGKLKKRGEEKEFKPNGATDTQSVQELMENWLKTMGWEGG